MNGLSGHDLDGPLPGLRPDVRLVSRTELNLRLAREHNWTVRHLYESTVSSHSHHVAIGSPADIANVMKRWIQRIFSGCVFSILQLSRDCPTLKNVAIELPPSGDAVAGRLQANCIGSISVFVQPLSWEVLLSLP
jgi:hypothetical protein